MDSVPASGGIVLKYFIIIKTRRIQKYFVQQFQVTFGFQCIKRIIYWQIDAATEKYEYLDVQIIWFIIDSTFWERVAHSVDHMLSLYFDYL